MKVVFMGIFIAAVVLFSQACMAPNPPDPRESAPLEFDCNASLKQNDFSSEVTFKRTDSGTYVLKYLSPDTICGLTNIWISGEQSLGFGMLEDTLKTPHGAFSKLVEAIETYYDLDIHPESTEPLDDAIQYIYKKFTISASPENGQILKISFPTDGILFQIRQETE